jgi:pSer/pThr/pTyr-binding forkhead associated (FHA) protein
MSADLLLTITDPRNAQKVIALPMGKFTLGSEKKNQIVLDDPTISWRHALLSNQPDGLWIEDLMSHTGTYIDGSRVEKKSPIKANQRVQIGGYLLQVGNLLEAAKPAAPPSPPPALTTAVSKPTASAPGRRRSTNSRPPLRRRGYDLCAQTGNAEL